MEKIIVESDNAVSRNIEQIGTLFPNCITETRGEDGKLKKAINFDTLRQMLSEDVIEGKESYEFTWVGKNQSIVEAGTPIQKTLRPCPEESVNWDTTENLYIEGDNLQVLKLLQKSYLGKIKMIYIDPPYNTGKDFIYNDDFSWTVDEWDEASGNIDDEGNRLFKNTDANGRFHSDWCSMMYSRLLVAQTLLRDDGVIFISIDDNEVDNLRKICDEVFGAGNFESCVSWRRRTNQPNDKSKMIAKVAEYILVYAKNSQYLVENKGFFGVPLSENRKSEYTNPDNDIRGPWSSNPWKAAVGRGGTKYTITTPTGVIYDETWYGTKETFNEHIKENRVHWTDGGNGYPRIKIYLSDAEKEGQAAINFFTPDKFGSNQEGSATLQSLMGVKGIFENPKPTTLIGALMKLSMSPDSIVLDFFSGSSTTAHATLQLNAEDGGRRKFIMVQIDENLDVSLQKADDKAKKIIKNTINFLDTIDKPHLLSELGKERIRRAGKKIKQENPLTTTDLDIGFRVLKLDDWNKKDVEKTPAETNQRDLLDFTDNLGDDRTDLDLLFGCLIDSGLELTKPITSEDIEGCTVYSYNEGWLVGCFAENVPESVIKQIAAKKPRKAVFRDSSFADSPAKINVTEIFKMISPDTQLKVI